MFNQNYSLEEIEHLNSEIDKTERTIQSAQEYLNILYRELAQAETELEGN